MQTPGRKLSPDMMATLRDLIARQLDGTATEDELRLLESLLTESREARRLYLNETVLHAQLFITAQCRNVAGLTADPAMMSARTEPIEEGQQGKRSRQRNRSPGLHFTQLAALAVVTSTVLAFVWLITRPAVQNEVPNPFDHLSHYENFEPPRAAVGVRKEEDSSSKASGQALFPSTTLEVNEGVTRFAAFDGADVEVIAPARYGVSSSESGVLFGGEVKARLMTPEARYSVEASNLKVVDLGTEFVVKSVDDKLVSVEVLDGEVEIQARRRLPLYFWNFDSPTVPLDDLVAGAQGMLEGNARLASGVIGEHGLHFDNSRSSAVTIHGGTGATTGTGRMACTSGITIEAMIVSHWSGILMDYDEIFRKEDGNHRILLSFQHDQDQGNYSRPLLTRGPCLSFGLNLEDGGYTELEVPLDGREGRPSLAAITDGHPHHVVATYDSETGCKAIYIDGRLQVETRFAPGSMIRSGGSRPAQIGNVNRREPFHGVIDELALYDFALTPQEVAEHFRRVQNGRNYFALDQEEMDQLKAERWQPVTHLVQGEMALFDRETAMPVHRVTRSQ